jgi:hypothetical protein
VVAAAEAVEELTVGRVVDVSVEAGRGEPDDPDAVDWQAVSTSAAVIAVDATTASDRMAGIEPSCG